MKRLRPFHHLARLAGFLSTSLLSGQGPAGVDSTPRETRAEQVDLVRDASVAESVSRSTNVDFESVRVDGQRNNTALSALSADQVLSVESTKVPTPDLDADAVGGLLRVTTRRAFDQPRRTLRGEAAAGYDELAARLVPDVSVTYGDVFGSGRRLGFIGTVQHLHEEIPEETIALNWNGPGTELREVAIVGGRAQARETNFNGTFDWKLGPQSYAFFRLDGSVKTLREEKHERGYRLEDAPAEVPAEGGLLHDASTRRHIRASRERDQNIQFSAGASLKAGRWQADLTTSHMERSSGAPEWHGYEFQREGIDLVYRRPEAAFPLFTAPSATAVDPADYRLSEVVVRDERQDESDSVAAFDLRRNDAFGSRPGWIKIGGKVRLLDTSNRDGRDYYVEGPAGFRMSDVSGESVDRATLDGRYMLGPVPSVRSLDRVFAGEPSRFAFDEDRTRGETDSATYEVTQNVYALYGMASAGFGATHVLAGVRLERTDNTFAANQVIFDTDGGYEATLLAEADTRYTQAFPGVHVTHTFSPRVSLFGSWTQSVIRPNYIDLVPHRRIRRSNRELEEGNPALRATLYTNYDLALDYDYGRGGTLALQLFHRVVEDPTLLRSVLLVDGPFSGYDFTRPENAGEATLSGLDLTWEQDFGAFNPRLAGASFELTYTFQHSEQTIEGRGGANLPLAEQPRHAVSAAFNYERGRYELNVQAKHDGRMLRAAGRSASEDIFSRDLTRWDLSLSRRLGERGRLVLDVENLTGKPEMEYQNNAALPTNYIRQLRKFRLGYRWEI